jgi:hypothetical protein
MTRLSARSARRLNIGEFSGAAGPLLRGRIAVLGYDGPDQPFFTTPAGRLSAHRLFYAQLLDLYAKLKTEPGASLPPARSPAILPRRP